MAHATPPAWGVWFNAHLLERVALETRASPGCGPCALLRGPFLGGGHSLVANPALAGHLFGSRYRQLYILNTKSEIDELDNELSTMILNTYTKTETDNLLANTYTKTENDKLLSDKKDTITALSHLEFKSLDLSGNLTIDWGTVTYGLDVVCSRPSGYPEIARFKSTGSGIGAF